MVERAHRQLKDALRSRLAGNDWYEHLPWVLLGLHAAPKEDSGVSSAELAFGAPISLPGELLSSDEKPVAVFLEAMKKAVPPPTRPLSYAAVTAAPSAALSGASHVYVRRGGVIPPLAPLYVGPYAVVQRWPKFFLLQIGGNAEAVSVDRLKPHLGVADVQPALPPKKGRPPSSSIVASSSSSPAVSAGGGTVAA